MSIALLARTASTEQRIGCTLSGISELTGIAQIGANFEVRNDADFVGNSTDAPAHLSLIS
jgi:hypothetical protein